MKKKIYFSLLMLAILLFLPFHTFNVFADTNVGGLITTDTTWKKASSPYIVTDNVLVNAGVTLTIEAGVTVRFNAGKALQINGGLIARGTDSEKITFTANIQSPSIEYWSGIIFSSSSISAIYDSYENYLSGSILEYCVIEYVGGTNGLYAVKISDTFPLLKQCTIQNNATYGVSINNSIYNTSQFIKLYNNNIINNNGIGINIHLGKVSIMYNTIKKNLGGIRISNGIGGTISYNFIDSNIGDSITGGISYRGDSNVSLDIYQNTITNNKSSLGGGIYLSESTGSKHKVRDNIIKYNTASSKGGGIYIYDAYGTVISNNNIESNIAPEGSAIYVYYPNIVYEFKYNNITLNGSSGSLSTVDFGSGSSFNNNNLISNIATYDIYNRSSSGSSNLNAKNNYWGTVNEDDIKARIYDWFDDFTKGFVDYSPFATSNIEIFGSRVLYANFTNTGIWKCDGSNWTQVTPNDPELMTASLYYSFLYGSFAGGGIWKWDGSTWTQITPNNPNLMVALSDILWASFAGGGIWYWNGHETWEQVTPNNPELMVNSGSTLYGSFPGAGIWRNVCLSCTAWTQVTPNNPELMVTLGTTLYGSFAGGGIWKWDGTIWTQITPNNPQLLVASGVNLYGSFAGAGIWRWDGTIWTQITPNNPQQMVASESVLFCDFGASGIWIWNWWGTWSQVTSNDPTSMEVGY